MYTQQIQVAGLTCSLFLPQHYDENDRRYPVIYINGDVPVDKIINEVERNGSEAAFILLAVCSGNWNDDFTPWSAPAFRKGEDAPRGLADAYIARLTEEIKPYMDANFRTRPEPEYTALFGYSLGGLTALYAIYKTDVFGAAGSLSGSLWYDGFCEFMEKEHPVRKDMKVYLSLGKKESGSRNPRMCKVAECTERARSTLAEQAEVVCFEWNAGGHFHDIPGRFARAVSWWLAHMPA